MQGIPSIVTRYREGHRDFNHCTNQMLRCETLRGRLLAEIQLNGSAMDGIDFSYSDLTGSSMRGGTTEWQQLDGNRPPQGQFKGSEVKGCQP